MNQRFFNRILHLLEDHPRLCIAAEKKWSLRTNCPTFDDWAFAASQPKQRKIKLLQHRLSQKQSETGQLTPSSGQSR
jgi:hypothetical protein